MKLFFYFLYSKVSLHRKPIEEHNHTLYTRTKSTYINRTPKQPCIYTTNIFMNKHRLHIQAITKKIIQMLVSQQYCDFVTLLCENQNILQSFQWTTTPDWHNSSTDFTYILTAGFKIMLACKLQSTWYTLTLIKIYTFFIRKDCNVR